MSTPGEFAQRKPTPSWSVWSPFNLYGKFFLDWNLPTGYLVLVGAFLEEFGSPRIAPSSPKKKHTLRRDEKMADVADTMGDSWPGGGVRATAPARHFRGVGHKRGQPGGWRWRSAPAGHGPAQAQGAGGGEAGGGPIGRRHGTWATCYGRQEEMESQGCSETDFPRSTKKKEKKAQPCHGPISSELMLVWGRRQRKRTVVCDKHMCGSHVGVTLPAIKKGGHLSPCLDTQIPFLAPHGWSELPWGCSRPPPLRSRWRGGHPLLKL